MIATAAFGDVVQQGGDIQRPAGLQLADKLACHRRHPIQRAGTELLQHAQSLDGVLVHREDMVGVELHQADDARPVGQEAGQEAGLIQQAEPLRRVAPHQYVEKAHPGLGVASQLVGLPGMADQGADRQRVDLQPPVTRGLDDAQHENRFAREVAVRGRRDQLSVGEGQPFGLQPVITAAAHGWGAECRALDRRLQHAGKAHHIARRQKQVLHEALGTVLHSVPGIAHPGCDDRLQVEGQPLLGTAGDVVEVKAHCPKEVPGPLDGAGLALHQQPAAGALGTDQLGHFLGIEGVPGEPVQRLQVAQPAAALLDVGFDHERRLAIAGMADGAFRALGGEKRSEPILGAHRRKLGDEFAIRRLVAGHETGVDQRGLDGGVLAGMRQAILHAARGMADLQAEIPQQIQHELD